VRLRLSNASILPVRQTGILPLFLGGLRKQRVKAALGLTT
jgi:hypothetical protein